MSVQTQTRIIWVGVDVVIANADDFGIEGGREAFGRLESAAREGLYRVIRKFRFVRSSLVQDAHNDL